MLPGNESKNRDRMKRKPVNPEQASSRDMSQE
jgi:hypothetical protein